MLVSQFDFDLPDSAIALRPATPRESARLMTVDENGEIGDHHVGDLTRLIRPGDILVVNDTRVLPVQLHGQRDRDGQYVTIEATLIKSLSPVMWQAFIKPGRRVRVGDIVSFGHEGSASILNAIATAKDDDGLYTLSFDHGAEDMSTRLHEIGGMPLPPYIRSKRSEDEQDKTDYQTIFAAAEGSVAAPTAGLHFTPAILEALVAKGVEIAQVTLHVGAGTFLPVKVDDTRDHKMHAEYGEVTQAVADKINAARASGGRVICVGTTALRLIESACDDDGVIHPFADETSIFITPGVRVRSADILMTNFHLPKSTLFMLVCAFSGYDTMKAAYDHAVETGYRFFSYGDASLLANRSAKSPR
ncbi:tRNA preQ1(34) S-adenosylmethionine ribosyltransferase-isomerase QueA [Asticcacaulis sp. SL142]|uniref:tRNA preQ1(34) S-adenosylmethionine ribosyltransferase-isomerase QueA n=1 Tax=Asticcacaulis sp. SL142 TaxID=2995155 RepID=UPI00226CE5A4|nr:tRNA preQ1(34) S-adenosylmethionine ribosyltransferase-isomerase QueA [Asticcacaulis sp. SL142]WAC48641.1 tRNA preQ1(34) S-adenosylmethionine ribosyltransferase-isomerase QueA [Asticcacaulis sp. SL142]